MKRIAAFLFLILSFSFAFSQDVNAIYSFTSYNTPNNKPYIEINISIDANSVEYKLNSSSKKEEALIELMVVINSDSTTLYAEKRDIKAEKTPNANSILDIQRVSLKNGKYSVMISIDDKNSPKEKIIVNDSFSINYPENTIAVSGVQIVEQYNKTTQRNIKTKMVGDITPYLFDAISKTQNQIIYYAEIYNADKLFGKDSLYILSVSIDELSTGKKVEGFQRIKRERAKNITPAFGELDITLLPQGSYYLSVEVRDGKNILYAYSSTAFTRYSDLQTKEDDTLPYNAFVYKIDQKDIDENINCLEPIANATDKEMIKIIVKSKDENEKRHFLYTFFRRINPENPEGEWKNYMENIDYVNKTFSNPIRKGYQTDMGRVYLQYGKPDILINEKFKATSGARPRTIADQVAGGESYDFPADGVSYMPYQIWKYKKTPFGEVNKGFVFYAPQNNLSEYFLLHSNAKGEPFDPYWEHRLTRNVLPEGVEGEAGVQFRRGY
ncbi:MAG: GWxTD domain-containing protein [Bacteroidales bacterium]|jgi:GWxTD domain-containing protein|nr:GWxTD domain-containing protein [Bacteroidales bacterium]